MITREEYEEFLDPFKETETKFTSVVVEREVLWEWSLIDYHTLFIFRRSGREIQVNMGKLSENANTQESVLFTREERALLLDIRKTLVDMV